MFSKHILFRINDTNNTINNIQNAKIGTKVNCPWSVYSCLRLDGFCYSLPVWKKGKPSTNKRLVPINLGAFYWITCYQMILSNIWSFHAVSHQNESQQEIAQRSSKEPWEISVEIAVEQTNTFLIHIIFLVAGCLYITRTRLFKYIENFTSKNWKFSDKKLWYVSYFCIKHRLWVLVRTASVRRF